MVVPVFAILLLGILGLAVDSQRAEKDFAGLVRRLVAAPTNISVQNAILATIHRSRFSHLPEAASEKVYRIALHALANNTLPAARNFALEIGRWHFGRCRPGKRPTVADEQAIQQDVLARCR
jgi:hypothetical protein